MNGKLSCDLCGGQGRVLRFSLLRTIRRPRPTTRGSGAIDLCQRCWERTAKPRMRPKAAA